MTHKLNLSSWKNPSGAYWPALDEFKTGCTYEHAGYFLTWLHSFLEMLTKCMPTQNVCYLIRELGVKL